ncbi:hypothetical protein Poli38472_004104 [Pythium oligandrum]|uniref:Essential protein Yae1 N-terminal domain-containing protein n=1 Tax=Pythium oligandrum TaxID=41045 RepID=A0A8K1CMQ5_PYTOL|nr:hypothetical protein Poli38472_004104 [Pythium oligandrum]|eukprot:TMW66339.1 hypothetical protein Poli38472_004104 [Pythium oligandrum]
MDITDAFDEISGWEEQLIAQGEELGIEKGRELGVEEGRELGLIKGTEIGSEVGFYRGCYATWKHMIESEELKSRISDRAGKSIASFGVLIESFELKNIVDEDIMHKLLGIRAKFKVITALLGLKNDLVFSSEDIHAHKHMSF